MTGTSPEPPLLAGTGNRAAAALIDLVVLLVLVAAMPAVPGAGGWPIAVVAFLYLAGFPLTPWRATPGKWICRIRIADRQGRPLHWRAAALRAGATVGWLALPAAFGALPMPLSRTLTDFWWLVFLLPWASIGLLPRRPSLFDLLAGSVVVTARAEPERIAVFAPPARTGRHLVGGLVLALFCLGLGALMQSAVSMVQVRNLHGRILYAIGETLPLRERIAEFHARTQRWPSAAELGMPDGTPYRDGGGYRVEAEGRIVIWFSVLPELKGRRLVFTPTPGAAGEPYRWPCRADEGLERAFLPAVCR